MQTIEIPKIMIPNNAAPLALPSIAAVFIKVGTADNKHIAPHIAR